MTLLMLDFPVDMKDSFSETPHTPSLLTIDVDCVCEQWNFFFMVFILYSFWHKISKLNNFICTILTLLNIPFYSRKVNSYWIEKNRDVTSIFTISYIFTTHIGKKIALVFKFHKELIKQKRTPSWTVISM